MPCSEKKRYSEALQSECNIGFPFTHDLCDLPSAAEALNGRQRVGTFHESALAAMILPEPGNEVSHAVLNRSRRTKTDIAHQIVDVGTGFRYVSGLHWHKLDLRFAPKLLL